METFVKSANSKIYLQTVVIQLYARHTELSLTFITWHEAGLQCPNDHSCIVLVSYKFDGLVTGQEEPRGICRSVNIKKGTTGPEVGFIYLF